MRPRPYEALMAAFSLACVVVLGLDRLGWLFSASLAGSLTVSLYPLFSFAAATGWLQGNLYARRVASPGAKLRPVLFAFYLLVPVGPFFMFRAMASIEAQRAAPLVPWFCAGILSIFFLVPVSLQPRTLLRRPRIDGSGTDRPTAHSSKHDHGESGSSSVGDDGSPRSSDDD